MPTLRLYHGTAHGFDAFRIREGGRTPNSALGVHLTEHAAIAADYACMAAGDRNGGIPKVLAVEVEVEKVALALSRERYLGIDPETDLEVLSHTDFADQRLHLIAQGFDALAADTGLGDDLEGAWVVFDPDRIRIVEELDVDSAYETDADDLPSGIVFHSMAFFDIAACPDEGTAPSCLST